MSSLSVANTTSASKQEHSVELQLAKHFEVPDSSRAWLICIHAPEICVVVVVCLFLNKNI